VIVSMLATDPADTRLPVTSSVIANVSRLPSARQQRAFDIDRLCDSCVTMNMLPSVLSRRAA
jgi:hypothetical protein